MLCMIFLSLLITDCGGGGGGSSSGEGQNYNEVPTISNLQLSPSSAVLKQSNGTITVTGTIDFTDSDGDITTLRLKVSNGTDLTSLVGGAIGETSGTVEGSFSISTESTGEYSFEVWLIDSQGNNSNKLSGTFAIKADYSGTHWTKQVSGTTDQLSGITWDGNQLVVVGNNGIILTSPDGITWTQRISGTSNDLLSIEWSGTQYIAVGEFGTILTSPDSINWTQQNSGIAECNLYDIKYSGSLYVAVGGEFRFPGNPNSNNTLILTSPDGQTWTKTNSLTLTNCILHGLTWSGSEFVAVSVNELFPSDTKVLSSTDGFNWTERTLGTLTNFSLFDIIWSGTEFVAVGTSGIVYLSPDSINWQVWDSGALNLWSVASAGNNYVTVGLAGIVATSSDGMSWASQPSGTGNTLGKIIWAGTQYVAVGDQGTILTSP